MSYYILPKINNQIEISPSTTSEDDLKPYISNSVIHYTNLIKQQIATNILLLNDVSYNNCDDLIRIINPCEYIFSKVPGSKYSVSKLKPESNFFYDILEVCNILNVFDIYENSNIHSLHITTKASDTIECFELLREKYEDNITSYLTFENIEEQFNFLVLEQEFDNLNSYFTFLAHSLITIINCQKIHGSCIIKIDNTCYKPAVDFIYILTAFYDKVCILKPNSSNVTTFEKYVVCKNYQGKPNFSNIIYHNLKRLIADDNKNIITSFLDYDIPYYFNSKIDDINIIIGNQQIEYLDLILNILKNKNRDERIESYKKSNILKSVAWCEKYKIPCNRFSEKVNMFLPLVNKDNVVNNQNITEKGYETA
jgi:hypothetical protein